MIFKKTLDRIGQLLALKKNKTHYADCVIRDEKGRICLLHRSYQDDFAPGKWCLPGGHIEDGEEPIFAAGRELEEETGYKDVPLFYLDKVDRKDSVSLYYEGFVFSQTPTLLDNDEHYRIQWVEPKDLDDYELLLDLKDTLAKLPLSPVPTLPEVAPIGEDLYTSWQNNLTSFDEDKIDESVFFKTIEIHKAVAAYELVTRAFDNDEITPEEFSRVHKVEKAEEFDRILELAKGTDTEVLEEIVKGAMVGEVRHWKDGDYKKNSNGEWSKVAQEKTKEQKQNKVNSKEDLKEILDRAQIINSNKVSHIYDSHYWDIDGEAYRVADHSKHTDELYKEGVNDFRSYDDLYNRLKSTLDLSDKTEQEKQFKLEAEKLLTLKDGIYITPDNAKFDEIKNATNYMWRRKDKFSINPTNKVEKMDTGSTPGFETVTENGKLVKGEDNEITKADHTKWL